MRRLASFAAALLVLAAAPAALAAPPSPRVTAENVARAIEANYYDPARGKAVADELRAEAARGGFDRFTDPRVLATELSRRLKPKDAHFDVVYFGEEPPQGPGPGGGGPPPPQGDPFRRGNYGFRQVELLPGNLGLIELSGFVPIDFDDEADAARRAADAAVRLVSGADAVIIDLRDNGGGSPAMVGYLASAFTPAGADIYNVFHSRQGVRSEAPGRPYPTPILDAPVYVLISGRTGSAAEALAYTLQAAKRAVIVGEASAGAANPGGGFPAGGGFGVFVSTGSPRNPITGGNWETTGVTPDVKVPAERALEEAQRLALTAVLARGTLTGPDRTDSEWALAALTPSPVPPQNLADFAGDYSGVTVSVDGQTLRYVRGRRPAWTLVPIGPDLFRSRDVPTRRIRFQRGPDGRVTALEIVYPEGPVGLYPRGA